MLKVNDILNSYQYNDKALRQAIYDHYLIDEDTYLNELLPLATPTPEISARITARATELVKKIRASDLANEGVEALLQQYRLDTQEGMILMCLAEALLRIPDAEVANKLIKDNFNHAHWEKYLGQSSSWLVNASTWGLMLTGYVVKLDEQLENKPDHLFNHLITSFGEPVIRTAIMQAMKFMGSQFILGRTLEEAFNHRSPNVSYTFDMLGEAALTQADADHYFAAYYDAIAVLGQRPEVSSSVSIKLSALHPRYERAKRERVLKELGDKLIRLVETAAAVNVPITIDAEEIDCLELSLELFEQVFTSNICQNWEGFGLAVQAYSKQALPVLCWLNNLANKHNRRIPLRLVKGAYWDWEIKNAQQLGISAYPVLTHKAATDVSYLACARYIFNTEGSFYPQFATHNAQTAICILEMAGERGDFEFQRLYGMGDAFFDILQHQYPQLHCRIYAPVGEYKELLPYLVRRLLENGANTSFVHQLVDENIPIDSLVKHPVDSLLALHGGFANKKIPLPPNIYGQARQNSRGINLNANIQVKPLIDKINNYLNHSWQAAPIINGKRSEGEISEVRCPYDIRQVVGTAISADIAQAETAITIADAAAPAWNATPVTERAKCLEQVADLFEENQAELIAICSREGGKTIVDGIREVREAVDFCRYYAQRARLDFDLQGRGIFVCISPWNFPLAIFTGQVTAALVAGNCVIAKPASPTPLVAYRAVELMHQAGIPTKVLHFLPGSGSKLGKILTSDSRIAGVAFTGSTETAQIINRSLAARDCEIAPLIAETGGQNAMLVDSSALPEQVVNDVIHSAFNSAGQRCSALRVLYLQAEIAPKVLDILKGAMMEVEVGDPTELATDLGPVINGKAKAALEAHINAMRHQATLICETPLSATNGNFIAPIAFEIKDINDIKKENFGPILHVIRYQFHDLDKVIDSINNYGYGLTLGVHSRDEATASYICQRAKVGNIYINRDIIGAIVGVQPFGGRGLSGTGPKAGGPHYLSRFAQERLETIHAPLSTGDREFGEYSEAKTWQAAPIIDGQRMEGERQDVYCLHNRQLIGTLIAANEEEVEAAITIADAAASEWNATPARKRAEFVDKLAELFEEHRGELVSLYKCETGQSDRQAIDEIDKAIQLCGDYAEHARTDFAAPEQLGGPTGERNELHLRSRGIFACISSSPISIFTSLVTAALVAGNSVIAKPAKRVSLVSYRVVELMYEAGIPQKVLQFLPGSDGLGELLVCDIRIAGIAFSGKAETARRINRSLAARDSAIVPLIVENGGFHIGHLYRFATEQTCTYNTSALGGNATLLSLGEG